jgi:hypothetical protein
MIETNYDYETGYHKGTVVEQDALAFLGVFKYVEDVPDRYYLPNFASDVDADDAWNAFDEEELEGLSYHTRQYVYGKAWREWKAYCDEHDVHPALADPQDIEAHLTEQRELVNKLKSTHDARFRPLFRWYRWMTFSTEFPHRYNPVVMAVLLNGATADIWQTRLLDRTNIPQNYE